MLNKWIESAADWFHQVMKKRLIENNVKPIAFYTPEWGLSRIKRKLPAVEYHIYTERKLNNEQMSEEYLREEAIKNLADIANHCLMTAAALKQEENYD